MIPFKNILLLGAGAVGILPAAKLLSLPGITLRVLADGERLTRYRADGLFLNEERLPLKFIAPEDAFQPDLILVAVKGWALEDAPALLKKFAARGTVILPLLNGIGAKEVLENACPRATVIRGFFLGHASVRTGNRIRQDGVGTFTLGDGAESRDAADLFRRAGLSCETPEDFRSALWRKYILNVGINQTQAVYRAGYGDVQKSPEMMNYARTLMNEAAAVAAAEGIPDTESMIDAAMKTIRSMPGDVKTSMLQDVLANRKTEVNLFAGELVRRAERHSIPGAVPENRRVLAMFS